MYSTELMHIKMYVIPVFTADKCWTVSYKVCLCFIVLSVIVCTVEYVYIFCGDQIFAHFVSFLSMIIYEVLYT